MRIVFMGTPEFAVPSLQILLDHGYDIVGVITSTDKYGGRGRKTLIESAVKKFAVERGLHILQPSNLKSPSFLEELKALEADLQIVVAFRMLPVAVWDMPPMGTYNLHASLLPAYRGAAPINWAIMSGEKVTGLTTFKLRHEIDTGSIAFQTEVPIHEDDTAGSIHDRMMGSGAQLVLRTVNAIEEGDIDLIEQDVLKVSKAPKIFHQDCLIDPHRDVAEVYNFVRGLSPYPTSWTKVDGRKLKIYKATHEITETSDEPGTLLSDGKTYLSLVCKNGLLNLSEIQIEGKRRMEIKSLLNGYDFTGSTIQIQ